MIWGAKVSPEFRSKVREISGRLQIEPDWLMAVMAFETGGRFTASVRNPASKAVGLIQFMPATARTLGTSSVALAAMTPEQQLPFVEKHLWPWRGRYKSLDDLYMAVLWPRAIGRDPGYALFSKPSKAYEQNRALDTAGKGYVSKSDAAAFVRKYAEMGREHAEPLA